MKNLIVIASLLMTFFSYLRAHKPSHTLELKSSYFIFAHDSLNEVYHHGGFEESLAGSFPMWKWLNFYASIGIAHVNGKSLNDCQKTSLLEIPIDIGLKIVFPLHKKHDFYLASGGRYAYFQQHNNSSFVDKHIHKHCGGFFVNGGFNVFATHHWFIGFFGEYGFIKASITPSKPNVFGMTHVLVDNVAVGISAGYAF